MEKIAFLFGPILITIGYCLGYAYLDGYYGFYDITISEFDPSIEQVLVHSVPALKNSGAIPFTISFLGATLALLMILCIPIMEVIGRPILLTYATIVSMLVYMLIQNAPEAGAERAFADYPRLRPALYSGDASQGLLIRMQREIPESGLYHLVSTPDTHYLIQKIDGGSRRWTIRVPVGELGSLAAYRQ